MKQIEKREPVVKSKKPPVQRTDLIAYQMVKSHSRVLGRSLDQPVERETLVDLVAQVRLIHGHPALWAEESGGSLANRD